MVHARELRIVLVVDDYGAAARLFRDVFGLEVLMDLEGQGGRGLILKLPTATLEVVDADHDRYVDELEVGDPQDNRVRVAVEVEDLAEAAETVLGTGAEAIAEPVDTPWGDRNQRFRLEEGLQLTLYQPT
ncbi:MAG TPA: VOC family protein [Actinomycetota bacterium]|jgi:catechol 2,3-dioxygenase-like lactoylglutathione lyase family enzyme|nr:VOC family protein [Actinomycetota bacterium]